jgi:hypothetical protein
MMRVKEKERRKAKIRQVSIVPMARRDREST